MVTDSIGATALKAAAVLSAISVVPPLFLDDRSRPSAQMLALGILGSIALVAISVALSVLGGKYASVDLRRRYNALVLAFSCASILLFILVGSRGVV